MAYRYQLSTDLTVAYACAHLEALTFPSLRRKAATGPLRDPLTALLASHSGQAVGLVLAERQPDGRTARLLSLAVLPAHRGRGVGTRLVAELERHLAQAGCELLGGLFQSNWSCRAAITRLLARRGWTRPEPRMFIARGRADAVATAPWWAAHRLAPGYSVFPWAELSAAERQDLHQRRQPFYPDELSPFQAASRPVAAPSLGLRHGGQVVGWLVTHQLAADTIQYTALFVAPEHRAGGQGLVLLGAAIARQAADGRVPYGAFLVHAANRGMMAFVRRRLQPMLAGQDVYWTQKSLAVGASLPSSRRSSESQPAPLAPGSALPHFSC